MRIYLVVVAMLTVATSRTMADAASELEKSRSVVAVQLVLAQIQRDNEKQRSIPKTDSTVEVWKTPAPVGYKWQSINGGPWKLVAVSKAPEVASPLPFLVATTLGTTARRADGLNTSSRDLTGTGLTIIGANTMVLRGGTNCAKSG